MVLLNLLTIFVVCLCVHFVLLSQGVDYRLSTNIMPTNYKIQVQPYLMENDGEKRFTFDGEVEIQIIPNINTNDIVLHSNNLNYSLKVFWRKDEKDTKMPLMVTKYDEITEKLFLTASQPLTAKISYILHFKYNGILTNDSGFYHGFYTDKKKNKKWFALTNLLPCYARRVFPSFDEPKFMATFDVTVKHHKSMKAISNTDIKSTKTDRNYVATTFDTTPNMSTYVVGFMVSNFGERTRSITMLFRPGFFNQAELGTFKSWQIVQRLSEYTRKSYEDMEIKTNMAAIPNFETTTTTLENWGFALIREDYLLLYDGLPSLLAEQQIIRTIIHRIAHTWFGYLVRPEWWNQAWIYEGFASFLEYIVLQKLNPKWSLDEQIIVDKTQAAMTLDADKFSFALDNDDIYSPYDSRIFSELTVLKAAAFIMMIRCSKGKILFQQGVRAFLDNHTHQSVTPHNFYAYYAVDFPNASPAQVSKFIESFTKQPGYPLVMIHVGVDQDSFKISQKRFLYNNADGSDASLLYTIPITYTTNIEKDFDDRTSSFLLDASTATQTIYLLRKFNWIIVNVGGAGYYRVNYNDQNWRNIKNALYTRNWGDIHSLNRAQIVDDLFNFACASMISFTYAMDILEYLETETNYITWKAAFKGFAMLEYYMEANFRNFSIYVNQLMEKAYDELGFEERDTDSDLKILNRINIMKWSCRYGHNYCIYKSLGYFNNMKNLPVPANMRSAVYCTAMRIGLEQDFNALFDKFKTTTCKSHRNDILTSLTCVKNKKLIEKYFWIILSNEVGLYAKKYILKIFVAENVTPAIELIIKNFEKFAESLKGYKEAAKLLPQYARYFTKQSQKKLLEDFYNKSKGTEKFAQIEHNLEHAINVATAKINLSPNASQMASINQYINKRISLFSTQRSRTNLLLPDALSIVAAVSTAMLTELLF